MTPVAYVSAHHSAQSLIETRESRGLLSRAMDRLLASGPRVWTVGPRVWTWEGSTGRAVHG